ncbi:hypothetical protein GOODEAATRI_014612 [Goodea atripinnis]|uniref:Uncharacterized protein n=1 Tax=Goodea atripinnis TaxID=208336 RepID=A0ABV0NK99_9TELE
MKSVSLGKKTNTSTSNHSDLQYFSGSIRKCLSPSRPPGDHRLISMFPVDSREVFRHATEARSESQIQISSIIGRREKVISDQGFKGTLIRLSSAFAGCDS